MTHKTPMPLPLKRTASISRNIHVAACAVSLLFAVQAHADFTWKGTGSSADWKTESNWSGDIVPSSTDTAVFADTNDDQVVRARNATIAGMIFTNTGTTSITGGGASGSNGNFTIGGGGITVGAGAGAVMLGSTTADFRIVSFILSASQTWTNNSAATLTRVGTASTVQTRLGEETLTITGSGNTLLQHDITGSGSIIKSGAGTLTVSGTGAAAAYTGSTAVSAGTLVLADPANINSTSLVSITSGATFTNDSSVPFSKSIAVDEGAILNGNGSFAPASVEIRGDLSGGSFTTVALGSTTFTKAGNLALIFSKVINGQYVLLSGSALSGAFDTMTIGGVALTTTGSGNFNGTVGGVKYTFTNATNTLSVTKP